MSIKEQADGAEPPRPGEDAALTPKSASRVLLVEDNRVSQQVAKAVLEQCGLQVDVVDNGQKAVAAMTEQQYHLIFMDCQMPVMDGYQATQTIRALEAETGSLSPIPIIALTASDLHEDGDKCLEAGMDDFLSKPFSRKQAAKILARWLSLTVAGKETVSGGKFLDREDPGADPGALIAPMETQPSLLDREVLRSIRDLQKNGGSGFLGKVIDCYLNDSARLMAQLLDALENGDAHSAHRAAHSLKASTAQIGASGLASLYKEIEQLTLSPNLPEMDGILRQATTAYARVREALIAERERIAK